MELPINYDKATTKERRVVREEYARRQGGRCYHCAGLLFGEPSKCAASMTINRQLFPEHFFRWPVHLHHNHKTGMTIGAVHCYCNAILWQYHGE